MAGQQVPHILTLSHEEKKKFLDSFDNVLFDCDGVLWSLLQALENVGDGINLLKAEGKVVKFVTNNSARSSEEYKIRFKKCGIDTDIEKSLFHPSKTAVAYLKKINFKGLIYCIATSIFKDTLREAGFEVIDGPDEPLEETFQSIQKHVFDTRKVDAVIFDYDFNLSAAKLMRADIYLRRPECILITGATDVRLPVSTNFSILGPGLIHEALANSAKKEAIVVGKPSITLGEIVKAELNIKDPKRTLFVGDMLEQDIGFGKLCGFQTLLVLSGGTTKEALGKHDNPKETPDFYADSVADFVKLFSSLKIKNVL